MKPVNRQDKLNQRERLEQDRIAQERIQELQVHKMLARSLQPLRAQIQSRQKLEKPVLSTV